MRRFFLGDTFRLRRVIGCAGILLGIGLMAGVARAAEAGGGTTEAAGGGKEAGVGASLAQIMPLLARMSGELKGVYTPVEGRALTWSAGLAAAGGTLRTGEAVVRGPDAVVRVALQLDTATGRMTWRVAEGRIDLGAWLVALASRPELAALAGTTATGFLEITGEGEWIDGKPTGTVAMTWREGTVRNDAQGWSLAGVTVQAGGEVAALAGGRVPVEVKVGTISTGRFGARNLTVGAVVNEFSRIAVDSARVEIAGGEVTAEPFSVAFAEPKLGVTLAMRRVGLQDLIVFVPTTLSDARGRINGRLHLDWNATDGVQVGVGELALDKSEAARLRMAENAGFLTANMPRRFVFVPPTWPRIFQFLLSSNNPSYPPLKEIELGKLGLHVETLEVKLHPEGDAQGRSASIFIRARPDEADNLIREVTFQINVSGPLASVLRVGMKQKISLTVH